MSSRISTLFAIATLATAASAGTVSIRGTGVVGGNSLSVSPLAGQPTGATVVMTFDVTTPGTPWTSSPAHGYDYAIDPATFAVDVNGAVLGMVSASEALTLINDFPTTDRLHVNVAGLAAGLMMTYEVGYVGATFSSLDITEQGGLYDFNGLTSYNWIINAPGSGAMFIEFTDVEIIVGPSGAPFCAESVYTCPCFVVSAAGEGCPNTTGVGGTLTGAGHASVSNSSFNLTAAQLPNTSGLFVQGTNAIGGSDGNPVGEGRLCLGPQKRYSPQSTSTGTVTRSNFQNFAAAGTTYYYQYWYRDPGNACNGGGFNFTPGWTVTWSN